MLQDSPKTGTGDLLISVQAIEPLKIPVPDKQIEQQVETLLHLQDYQSIDNLIYKMYGLSGNEVRFIESII
jgi:hypothetical protein